MLSTSYLPTWQFEARLLAIVNRPQIPRSILSMWIIVVVLCSSSNGLLDVCETIIAMDNIIYFRHYLQYFFLDHPLYPNRSL